MQNFKCLPFPVFSQFDLKVKHFYAFFISCAMEKNIFWNFELWSAPVSSKIKVQSWNLAGMFMSQYQNDLSNQLFWIMLKQCENGPWERRGLFDTWHNWAEVVDTKLRVTSLTQHHMSSPYNELLSDYYQSVKLLCIWEPGGFSWSCWFLLI